MIPSFRPFAKYFFEHTFALFCEQALPLSPASSNSRIRAYPAYKRMTFDRTKKHRNKATRAMLRCFRYNTASISHDLVPGNKNFCRAAGRTL